MVRRVCIGIGALLLARASAAQFVQQGPKLVAADAAGVPGLGASVALSADGNTAVVGAPRENAFAGTVRVFKRATGVWSQQGSALVPSGGDGPHHLGLALGISANAGTLLVGDWADNSDVGAGWIFTRAGGAWVQQGGKLVGTGIESFQPAQGWSVALSADGGTAILGAPQELFDLGAAWVFARTGSTWAQQGAKLVANDGGVGAQGCSVALSADGDTAIVGAFADGTAGFMAGAALVFTRSGGVWSPHWDKLVGSGAGSSSLQGFSVAISADGDTALVGGPGDNGSVGGAWVFTREHGVWSQQGGKLVGSDAVGTSGQGGAVALSADGNTAVVGGQGDDGNMGASWVFTRSAGEWAQQGGKLVGTGAVGPLVEQGLAAISADGTTILVGGPWDDSQTGAAWVFTSTATRLAFAASPSGATAGQPLAPAVVVQLVDDHGAAVAQAGVTVMVWLASGTGTLGGTRTRVTDRSGAATFGDLSIDLVGAKQLAASNPGRAPAVSGAFTVTAGAAASIAATGGTPQSAPANFPFAQPLEVNVTDAFGNPVGGASVTFGAPSDGPSAFLVGGGQATTDAAGRASVRAIADSVVGGPYVVTATAGTLPPVAFRLTNLSAVAVPLASTPAVLVLAAFLLALGSALLRPR
ncbi:MAG TPA: hypothetical protein VLW17_08615 [Thermoanaerobaculaceae bacterium]|nr:hypothetical protein [Thermoanaerobaculaceae bacterium]